MMNYDDLILGQCPKCTGNMRTTNSLSIVAANAKCDECGYTKIITPSKMLNVGRYLE